jgi:hypothetical protein
MSENRSEWTSPDTWLDPDCIECGGEGAPCCEPPDQPAPIDWPARFRCAAEVAQGWGWTQVRHELSQIAGWMEHLHPDVVEAIGRAMLGEAS